MCQTFETENNYFLTGIHTVVSADTRTITSSVATQPTAASMSGAAAALVPACAPPTMRAALAAPGRARASNQHRQIGALTRPPATRAASGTSGKTTWQARAVPGGGGARRGTRRAASAAPAPAAPAPASPSAGGGGEGEGTGTSTVSHAALFPEQTASPQSGSGGAGAVSVTSPAGAERGPAFAAATDIASSAEAAERELKTAIKPYLDANPTLVAARVVRPASRCSPRHTMKCISINEGSQSASVESSGR